VAPLRRKSTGSFRPKTEWLLYAEIEMAPYCRKFTEARARYRWSPALLRRRYREHAALARWTLPAALASLGIGVIRWGLGDGSGGLPSLSAALLLLALGLRPAYRCWSIRRRTLGGFSDFLRRPQAWWPPPLPDDYTP
jgi:hypothetical protein